MKRPKGENHSSSQVEAVAGTAKRAEIVELRRLGFSYREIGKKLGIDDAHAFAVVSEYMQEFRRRQVDKIEDMVLLEVGRIDDAIRVFHAKIMQEADHKSAMAYCALVTRKAALLGLDKALKVEIEQKKGYVGISPDDWVAIGKKTGHLADTGTASLLNE